MASNILKLSAWNIQGNFDVKLHDDDFVCFLVSSDFIGLTETWCTYDSVNSIIIPNNYIHFFSCRKGTGPNIRGGVSLLFHEKFKNFVMRLESSNDDFLFVKIDKVVLKSEQDLYVGIIYIPPYDSPYIKSMGRHCHYSDLEADVIKYSKLGHLLLTGDFNTRIKKKDDFIPDDCGRFLPCFSSYREDINLHRQSLDPKPNAYCNDLLNLCIGGGLRILNGRITGDYLGQLTCHKYNGSSLVDYSVVDTDFLDYVQSFYVDFLTPFSDHCQISTYIEFTPSALCQKSKQQPSITVTQTTHKSVWTEASATMFQRAVIEHKTKFDHFVSNDMADIDKMVEEFSQLVGEVALKSQILKVKRKNPRCQRRKSTPPKKSKPWFNQTLKQTRTQLFDFCKLLSKHPFDPFIRGKVFKLKKLYKRQCRSAKALYSKTIIQNFSDLKDKDPKSFWDYLKKVKSESNDSIDNPKNPISAEDWQSHFKSTLSHSMALNDFQREICTKLEDLVKTNEGLGPLDGQITEQEIMAEIKHLKNGKSSGPDNILNELLKSGSCHLLPSLHKLFNAVLSSGQFPTSWATDYLTVLHKKGSKTDPNNYRGISLSSCLGKLFTRILNTRLTVFLDNNSIIPPEQAGFRKNFRTTDNVFILKSLHDKYRYARKTGLYTCFVDFSKAFDSVWRPGLLYKLQKSNVTGNVFNIIQSCLIKVLLKLNYWKVFFLKSLLQEVFVRDAH